MFKKSMIRSVLSLLLVMLMASASLAGCSQASTSNEANSGGAASEAAAADMMTIPVEIDPTAADGKVDLPSADLTVISDEVELEEGANAYDALVATGATLEGSSSYVTSINGLAEKAAGETYGWMYEVNGEAPTVAADAYVLKAGDAVRWYYSSWDAS